MENAVDRHRMVANNKSRTRGIIDMLIAVPDPPRAGGVKAMPKTGKGRLQQTGGIAAEKATKKASVRRRRLIQKNPD